MKNNSYKIDLGLGTLKCENFSAAYPELNKELYINGDRQDSRNGLTGEVLGFKTILTNPMKRCVGGYGRNMNVFFLLAEAIWIFNGHDDVEFMDIFNSQLKNYSDDGIVYHAPYGFRLRNYGVSSSGKGFASLTTGMDQIVECIEMLEKDNDSRRVAATIWNPLLDLNTDSKDLPCNDLLMWKIRNGKLNITIGNRSNDLHWGLTTNIFQFSFLNEIMARCLGVELGSQIHLSDSLHVYRDLKDCTDMINQMSEPYNNIYDDHKPAPFHFDFTNVIEGEAVYKFRMVETYIEKIINNLRARYYEDIELNDEEFSVQLAKFSNTLFEIYTILKIYVGYKKAMEQKKPEMDAFEVRITYFKKLLKLNKLMKFKHQDFYVMALNFFMHRMDNMEEVAARTEHLEIPIGVGTY